MRDHQATPTRLDGEDRGDASVPLAGVHVDEGPRGGPGSGAAGAGFAPQRLMQHYQLEHQRLKEQLFMDAKAAIHQRFAGSVKNL